MIVKMETSDDTGSRVNSPQSSRRASISTTTNPMAAAVAAVAAAAAAAHSLGQLPHSPSTEGRKNSISAAAAAAAAAGHWPMDLTGPPVSSPSSITQSTSGLTGSSNPLTAALPFMNSFGKHSLSHFRFLIPSLFQSFFDGFSWNFFWIIS